MDPDHKPKAAPICIAGMHRSGTSMTARLLNLCGVYLGPTEGLLPPQPDNPSGFWELQSFVDINESLLSVLGGAWDRPPTGLASGGFDDPAVAPLRLRALELAAGFRGHEPWGFKDPRNSLTLPFWNAVMGPLQFVICVRNPNDVVRSLEARGSKVDSAYRLWESHYRALIAGLEGLDQTRSIVVHYESFFADAPSELRRVTDFLGLDLPEASLLAACGSIDPSLRRNVSSIDDLERSGAPASVVELYAALCRRAGPRVPKDAAEPRTAADVLAVRLERVTDRLRASQERVAELDAQLGEAQAKAQALRDQVLGWRALAERGEPVRRAWGKMTLLLKHRDPVAGVQRHGAEMLDDELGQAVRLYALAAREEGQADVADDLQQLAGLIDGALTAARGPAIPEAEVAGAAPEKA